MRPPRLPARSVQPTSDSKISEEERAVFGDRKYYSLSLNMPNLNSAGGSWIIRFAPLKPEASADRPSAKRCRLVAPQLLTQQRLTPPQADPPRTTCPRPWRLVKSIPRILWN